MKKNYRGICLIGAGRAGMIHARNFQRSVPGFRIVSVADPMEEAAASACRELEIENIIWTTSKPWRMKKPTRLLSFPHQISL